MRFRPCIDLRRGAVTQIVGSTLTAATADTATAPPAAAASPSAAADSATAAASPASSDAATENFVSSQPSSHYAALYRRLALRGGHVIMLGPGNEAAAREALAAWPGGLQVGGGIDDGNALQWLAAGASAVIVTSWLFVAGSLDMDRLRRMEALVGRQRLVVDLSCRRRPGEPSGPYYVVTNRWQSFSSLALDEAALGSLGRHCAEVLIHGVDVEGRRAGVEEQLIRVIRRAMDAPGGDALRVVYAGGVRDMADVRLVDELGGGRIDVSIGSALDIFGGDLPFEQVAAYCSDKGENVS